MVLSPLGFLGFNAILAVAAASDLRHMRIPNLLPASLALASLLLAWPAGLGELGSRLASGLLIGSAGLGLYVFRLLGGGDLKLLSAASLWMPMDSVAGFLVLLALAGGLQGLVVLAYGRLANGGPTKTVSPAKHMPYAVSIAAAGCGWSILHTYPVAFA